MTVSISGKHHWVAGFTIKSNELLPMLKRLAGVENSSSHYYLPRQNKPDGITGDGGFVFNLKECSDFVLVPLPSPDEHSSEVCRQAWNDVNLYGTVH